MKAIPKSVTAVLLAVFFVGICVLLYPSVAQYWNARVQTKALATYQENTENLSTEVYDRVLAEAQVYNAALQTLPFPLSDYKSVVGYEQTLNVDGSGVIGAVSIDKIKVRLPIYHGVSESVLANACGHLPGSSLPIGGDGTHAVLSAHRGLPSARLFTDLDKLQIGDTFQIEIFDRVLLYEIDQIKTVQPTDTSDLQIESDKDLVTLVTCTPYGINTHRLLVRGHRISTTATRKYAVTTEACIIDRTVVTPVVALPMLLVLFLIVLFMPGKKRLKLKGEGA